MPQPKPRSCLAQGFKEFFFQKTFHKEELQIFFKWWYFIILFETHTLANYLYSGVYFQLSIVKTEHDGIGPNVLSFTIATFHSAAPAGQLDVFTDKHLLFMTPQMLTHPSSLKQVTQTQAWWSINV